jgi:hypothetical protein
MSMPMVKSSAPYGRWKRSAIVRFYFFLLENHSAFSAMSDFVCESAYFAGEIFLVAQDGVVHVEVFLELDELRLDEVLVGS